MFCSRIQLANILMWAYHVALCTIHHSKELDRCVPTTSLHHRDKSWGDESSHRYSIQDIVSPRTHGSIPPQVPPFPRRKCHFPHPASVGDSMWTQSSVEPVCPRHAFPALLNFQLIPALPFPAAVRQLGDPGPSRHRATVQRESQLGRD